MVAPSRVAVLTALGLASVACAVSPYVPGACGATKRRCLGDADCPEGCGACWCFGVAVVSGPTPGEPGLPCAETETDHVYGGDLSRGFCTNFTTYFGTASGAGARGWDRSPEALDLACGGPPIPAEGHAGATKQYLMIGDSVSQMVFAAKDGLNQSLVASGDVAPYHAPINCGLSGDGRRCVLEWLGTDLDRWDVISMNFGQHDADEEVATEDYIENLRNITTVLLETRAARRGSLLWANTNPVPVECGSLNHKIEELNTAAWRVLKPLGFQLVDLAAKAESICGPAAMWRNGSCSLMSSQETVLGCNVHPSWEGAAVFAERYLAAVLAAADNETPEDNNKPMSWATSLGIVLGAVGLGGAMVLGVCLAFRRRMTFRDPGGSDMFVSMVDTRPGRLAASEPTL